MDRLGELKFLPRDEEDPRYCVSFDACDKEGITAFFEEYGVVVIRDIISQEASERTQAEMVEILESDSGFRMADESTWDHWPKSGMSRYGQLQKTPLFTRQFLDNRQNERILSVFSTLLDTLPEELIVSHDRACIYRPVSDSHGVHPSRATRANYHLDLNPWKYYGDYRVVGKRMHSLAYGNDTHDFIKENNQVHSRFTNVQGGLNLRDNLDSDGGFVCVPGFHRLLERWAEENEGSRFNEHSQNQDSVSFSISGGYALDGFVQRVPSRANSLIVWDQRTPHGSAPNDSTNFRFAQFLKCFPRTFLGAKQRRERRHTVRDQLAKSQFHPTGLGKCVFDQ